MHWGGTSIWSINNAAHRAFDSGSDPSGLGRWSWTRYRGRGNVTLRIISAYRPCDSQGPLTVYAQHQNFFDDQDVDGCPRSLFITHLLTEIDAWTQLGDQIILLIDANEDIRSFAQTIQHTGLREVLLTCHGNHALATYNGGLNPIDGIFASPSIDILVGGYLEFGFGPPTDHRGLWVNIHYQVAFGHIMPAIATAQARRLKTKDLRIVKRYTDVWSQFITDHNMLTRAYQLQATCTYPLSPSLQREMDALDTLRHEGVLLASRKCRKLPMGAVAWSPTIQRARELVETWGLILKKKEGKRVSSRLLSRGMSKLHIVLRIQEITLDQIIAEKRAALKEYRFLRKSSLALRQTHLKEIAEARAAVGNNTKATEI